MCADRDRRLHQTERDACAQRAPRVEPHDRGREPSEPIARRRVDVECRGRRRQDRREPGPAIR